MSSIKLKHSGGNSVSLNPPTSAPTSSEVAFKLPTSDGSAGQVLMTDGSGNLSWSTPTSALTEVDQWLLTSDMSISGSATTVTSGWGRSNLSTMGLNSYIGTGISESSGIFTFPSTGKYLIMASAAFKSSDPNNYVAFRPMITTDNASYNYIGVNFASIFDNSSSQVYANAYSQALVDITNVSTHKVRFSATGNSNVTVMSNGSTAYTSVIFMKLGET